MKHPILTAAVLTVTLLTGAAVYAADAGTAEDPLVTLSYMTTTFKQEITELFQSKLDRTASNLEQTMAQQVSAVSKSQQTAATAAQDTAWQTVTLTAGQALEVSAGAQVLPLSGSASFSGGTISDTTVGASAKSAALTADHLYLVSAAGTVSGEGQLLVKP
jgi:hypothetical protein